MVSWSSVGRLPSGPVLSELYGIPPRQLIQLSTSQDRRGLGEDWKGSVFVSAVRRRQMPALERCRSTAPPQLAEALVYM